MSLVKQKNSRFWYVHLWYRDVNGKQCRLFKSTMKESKAEALQVEAVLKESLGKKTAREKMVDVINRIYEVDRVECILTFEMVWQCYLLEIKRKNLAARTVQSRYYRFLTFQKWCKKIGIVDFCAVSRSTAIAYIDSLKDSEMKGKTINGFRSDLVTIVSEVLVRLNLNENVFLLTKVVNESDSVTGRAFSDDEVELILGRCKSSKYGNEAVGLCLFLLYTGLRIGDIVLLRKDNIVDDVLVFIPCKTQRHKIKVNIPLHKICLDYVNNCDDVFLFPNLKVLFSMISSWRRFSLTIFSDFDSINYKIGWHCFRHTFRTNLSRIGADLEVAKKLLGHSNDSMSMHYNHDLSKIKSAIDKLPNVFQLML